MDATPPGRGLAPDPAVPTGEARGDRRHANDAGRARPRSRGVRPGARARPPARRRRHRPAHPVARRAPARRARQIARTRTRTGRRHRAGRDRAGAVLAGLDLPALVASDAGLREGILLDAVGWRPSSAATLARVARLRPDALGARRARHSAGPRSPSCSVRLSFGCPPSPQSVEASDGSRCRAASCGASSPARRSPMRCRSCSASRPNGSADRGHVPGGERHHAEGRRRGRRRLRPPPRGGAATPTERDAVGEAHAPRPRPRGGRRARERRARPRAGRRHPGVDRHGGLGVHGPDPGAVPAAARPLAERRLRAAGLPPADRGRPPRAGARAGSGCASARARTGSPRTGPSPARRTSTGTTRAWPGCCFSPRGPGGRGIRRPSRRTTSGWSGSSPTARGSSGSPPIGTSSRCSTGSVRISTGRSLDLGVRLRVLVPFGEDWYGYFVRRLAERPGAISVPPHAPRRAGMSAPWS